MTGSLRHVESDAVAIDEWFGEQATGDEYGGLFILAKTTLAGMWGIHFRESVEILRPPEITLDDSLQNQAAEFARRFSSVEVERPVVPALTGELLEDARAVTGLTLDQIGRATRVSGRAVASWRAGTVPPHREEFLQRLRSIGLSLVGGLGPSGVQRWFMAGAPTRLDRLAAGDVEQVATEARAYETSPAT